jgi:predicted dehydrogenase
MNAGTRVVLATPPDERVTVATVATSAAGAKSMPSVEGRRPRLGFLGVGWIGRNRMEALGASGLAEVAGIFDPTPEMRQAALAAAPGATAVESLDQLLELSLDGLVIATPSALHATQTLIALEAGIPVFCQKPLGRTLQEVSTVVEAARRADLLLSVDFSYRFATAFRHLRELVKSGEIGEVYAANLVFHNAYGPDKGWCYDPSLAGGGCVMDLGVHLVDMALWVLGFPTVDQVSSRLFSTGRPLDGGVEDYATARLDLAGGATVDIACSWKLPVGQDAIISATFYGTQGGVEARNVAGSFYDFIAERYRGTSKSVLAEPPDAWTGRAAVDWARRLSLGERFDPASTQLLRVAQVLDRVYGR